MINKEDTKYLKEYGIKGILTSIHSSKAKKHDSIVGKKGAFKKTLKGIEKVLDDKIPLEINYVASKNNINEIKKTAKLMKNLGVNNFTVAPLIQNKNNIYSNRINLEDLNQILWQLYDIKEELKMNTRLQRAIPYCFFWKEEKLRFLANTSCSAGSNSINVKSDGELMPCAAIYQKIGNILNENKDKLWKKLIENKESNRPKEPCNYCDLKEKCNGGCWADIRNMGISNKKKPIKINQINKRTKIVMGNKLELNKNARFRKETKNMYLIMEENKYHLVSNETYRLLKNIGQSYGLIVDDYLIKRPESHSYLEDLVNKGILNIKEEKNG